MFQPSKDLTEIQKILINDSQLLELMGLTNAKLTDTQADEIREIYSTQTISMMNLGKKYNVSELDFHYNNSNCSIQCYYGTSTRSKSRKIIRGT